MGPGIVGTGTKWGFTGIEQGDILNAVDVLQGIPIAVPRVSFADPRKRHYGLSHHTITVLSKICRVNAVVPLSLLEEEKMNYIFEQLRKENLIEKYKICVEDSSSIIDLIKNSKISISTMGRGANEDREFFLTLGAAAITAQRIKNGEQLRQIYLV